MWQTASNTVRTVPSVCHEGGGVSHAVGIELGGAGSGYCGSQGAVRDRERLRGGGRPSRNPFLLAPVSRRIQDRSGPVMRSFGRRLLRSLTQERLGHDRAWKRRQVLARR